MVFCNDLTELVWGSIAREAEVPGDTLSAEDGGLRGLGPTGLADGTEGGHSLPWCVRTPGGGTSAGTSCSFELHTRNSKSTEKRGPLQVYEQSKLSMQNPQRKVLSIRI